MTPRIPMELCGGVFFCQTRRESNQGLKVWFLDVLNPGLEGFDTVLGGLFGLGGGGGGDSPHTHGTMEQKKIFLIQ